MASVDGKRASTGLSDPTMYDFSYEDSALTEKDAPGSPLSDHPENLSTCSEALAEQHDAQETENDPLSAESPRGPALQTITVGDTFGKPLTALPETPRPKDGSTLEHGLATPPETVKGQQRANQDTPSPTPTQSKLSQNGNARTSSESTNCHSTTQSSLSSTLRRSGRARRPPPQFNSLPKPPRKVPASKKKKKTTADITPADTQLPSPTPLVLWLPTKTEELARIAEKQPHLPGQAALKKRKPEGTKEFEEPVLQRPRIEQPSSLPLDLRSQNVSSHQLAQSALLPMSSDQPLGASVDPDLRSLSKQLFAYRTNEFEKPKPTSEPEIWAADRQSLCETLPYFRAYKSAGYAKDNLARAFMFANIANPRDYTDPSVVISRAGGGMVYNPDTLQMESNRDQDESRLLKTLRKNIEQCNPVVIISDRSNPCMPSELPHKYCVLDYFKPTHIWAEKAKDKIFWRYRFEKLNTKKASWWQPQNTEEVAPLGSLSPPLVQTCSRCTKECQQVYLQGWMCTNADCPLLFKLPSGSGFVEPDEKSLDYDPRFLKQRTVWGNDDFEYPLIMDAKQISKHQVPGEDCMRAAWLGVVCPRCHRCIPRLKWTGWECPTSDCGYVKDAPRVLIPALATRDPFHPLSSGFPISRDVPPTGGFKLLAPLFIHPWRIHIYAHEETGGAIFHFSPSQDVIEGPAGPDAMFEELQQEKMGLDRRPLQHGSGYTRHHAINFGMTYKFAALTESESFEVAPRAVRAARSRLNWAGKLALALSRGKKNIDDEINKEWTPKEFNELLTLAYLEDQHINYHDDGEEGLGDTIATMSIGFGASMNIRMKKKYFSGVNSGGALIDEPPLQGSREYDSRMSIQPWLDDLRTSNLKSAEKDDLKKAKANELGLYGKIPKSYYDTRHEPVPAKAKDVKAKDGPVELQMHLAHGDIVIMQGQKLQSHFEHEVKPGGLLRFALTCRYIDPSSLDQLPAYEVGPDPGSYDGFKLPLSAQNTE